LTLDGGDREAEKEVEEESDQETKTDPDADQKPVPDISGELQEHQMEAHSENKPSQGRSRLGIHHKKTGEVQKSTRSEEKLSEADLSQGPTFRSLERPALG
jgi:hypothetical protein